MQVGAILDETMKDAGSAPSPRLTRAAHEFEGQMMKELLEPMLHGDAWTGEEDNDGTGSGDALGEFAAAALGEAMSERGGFGIANRIVRELTGSGNHPHTER